MEYNLWNYSKHIYQSKADVTMGLIDKQYHTYATHEILVQLQCNQLNI